MGMTKTVSNVNSAAIYSTVLHAQTLPCARLVNLDSMSPKTLRTQVIIAKAPAAHLALALSAV